eukprot:g70492.t1
MGKGGGRPVVCVETGEVFPSIAAAARFLDVGKSCISNAITYQHKSGGLHWQFLDGGIPGLVGKSSFDLQ